MTLNWVLNVGFAVTGVLVLIGWLRHRGREDDRNINPSEISPDLLAGQELLEDALSERIHSGTEWAESHPATPADPPG